MSVDVQNERQRQLQKAKPNREDRDQIAQHHLWRRKKSCCNASNTSGGADGNCALN